jgi:plastocyanin
MHRHLLILAVAGLLLFGAVLAGCATTPTTNATTVPTTVRTTSPATGTAGGSAGQATTVDIAARDLKFDRSTITVPAGAQVTVNFNNQDSGVPHNVAFYTDSSASTAIYKGQVVTGPTTTTYTFTAPSAPGTYFFRCDVHPTQMTGTFVVQ